MKSKVAKNDARKRMLDLSMRNTKNVCTRNMRRVWYVLRHDSAWRARREASKLSSRVRWSRRTLPAWLHESGIKSARRGRDGIDDPVASTSAVGKDSESGAAVRTTREFCSRSGAGFTSIQ